jgi:SPP1 gp7 family putative phage head morphogenesis protein
MPDSRNKQIDAIIGRSLLVAETFASELRERLITAISDNLVALSRNELLTAVREILDDVEPTLAAAMGDAEIMAFIAGVDSVENKLPALVRGELEGRPRRNAFTVANLDTEDAIATVRDVLAESIAEGPSLQSFRKELEERLEGSRLGPAHLENVYRTNIQRAFHDGRDQLATDPTVQEVFPYREYIPIRDSRTRPDHLALETLGLSNTGVYRAEDPFWEIFRPPWDYQCRCSDNLLTIEAAARKGVIEAQVWQRTDVKPPLESRLPFISFRPDPSWVS